MDGIKDSVTANNEEQKRLEKEEAERLKGIKNPVAEKNEEQTKIEKEEADRLANEVRKAGQGK
jgi:hypothetical protein